MEQRPHVLLVEIEPVSGRREQSHHLAVFDHHALGQARGAGGVDHIRQVAGGQLRQHQILVGLVLPALAVQVQYRHRQGAQQLAGSPLDQHHHWLAVLYLVGETFHRRRRVQRHIGAAGLENRQQADDHRQPALDTDRHARIGPYALLAQVAGQAIGAAVQFAVGQLPFAIDHRHRLRRALGPTFEQLVQGVRLLVVDLRAVAAHQQLLTLRRRQHRQAVQGTFRRLLQGVGEGLEHRLHRVAEALRAHLRQRQGGQVETFAQVIDAQGQWIVGAAFVGQGLDTLPGLRHVLPAAGAVAMPVVEHGAEQR